MYLNKLREILVGKQFLNDNVRHYIPSLWINSSSNQTEIPVNFPQFLVNKIDEILFISKNSVKTHKKIRIYNTLIRLTTAFDHCKVGRYKLNNLFFKNDGTFVKTIALLPYLKELGITHLYFLPVTQIGIDGRKGQLGSPYSIKNHMQIEESLSEHLIEISVDEQFKALIEACHLLDIKVVLEFALRTASKDSDLILEHPDWFYWIASSNATSSFKPPKFSEEELKIIKHKVENKDFEGLIPPNQKYTNIFCETPEKVFKQGNKIFGMTKDNHLCEIPGAFADWPPDDKQPLWSDVTYLKLHTHPNFNYIAYNTVRMYDSQLENERYINKELWNYLANIIPHYIKEFNIDGVMIDMGHALPRKLLQHIVHNAKKAKPDLLLIEENFVISNESIDRGFDIVVGYLPFDLTSIDKTAKLIKELEDPNLKIKYFGTAETHNTPRAYWRTKTKNYSIFAYLLSNLLSNSVPFIHNGFELLEQIPVNTGLDFSEKDLTEFSTLPLFDYSELSWLNKDGNIVNEIRKINNLIDSHNFIISNVSIIEECILKIDILQNAQKAMLLVNYSPNCFKLKLNAIDVGQIDELLNFDVELTDKEMIFKSYFAFIFGFVNQ